MTVPAMTIGGDVAGLGVLGATLAGVAPDVRRLGDGLIGCVTALVRECGWNGDAAETFQGVWEQDAAAIERLAESLSIAGSTVTRLAAELTAAQRQLDAAVARARAAGVAFDSDGRPVTAASGPAGGAAARFAAESAAIRAAAQAARDAATLEISALLDALAPAPNDDPSKLSVAGLSGLGSILAGYYRLAGDRDRLSERLAEFRRRYDAKQFEREHSAARSRARANLKADLKQMRAEGRLIETKLAAAERLSGCFRGGKLLAASVGDLAGGLGGLRDASKFSRALYGVPILDVAAAGLATWAQATADHEKGWSWTHAIAADGGANLVGLVAGIGADFIPVVGPGLAPVAGYAAGAWTYQAFHSSHVTAHIHNDGVILGGMEAGLDVAKATWEVDGVDMGKTLFHDALHPVSAATNLWHGLGRLF